MVHEPGYFDELTYLFNHVDESKNQMNLSEYSGLVSSLERL